MQAKNFYLVKNKNDQSKADTTYTLVEVKF